MNSGIRSSILNFSAVIVVGMVTLGLGGCERESLEAESRDLGSFEAVELRGAAELDILVGNSPSIKIEGTEYAVKNLRTEVHDNMLSIEAKKTGWAWFGDRDELKLTITTPKLTTLQSSGAGNIQVRGLDGGEQT